MHAKEGGSTKSAKAERKTELQKKASDKGAIAKEQNKSVRIVASASLDGVWPGVIQNGLTFVAGESRDVRRLFINDLIRRISGREGMPIIADGQALSSDSTQEKLAATRVLVLTRRSEFIGRKEELTAMGVPWGQFSLRCVYYSSSQKDFLIGNEYGYDCSLTRFVNDHPDSFVIFDEPCELCMELTEESNMAAFNLMYSSLKALNASILISVDLNPHNIADELLDRTPFVWPGISDNPTLWLSGSSNELLPLHRFYLLVDRGRGHVNKAAAFFCRTDGAVVWEHEWVDGLNFTEVLLGHDPGWTRLERYEWEIQTAMNSGPVKFQSVLESQTQEEAELIRHAADNIGVVEKVVGKTRVWCRPDT